MDWIRIRTWIRNYENSKLVPDSELIIPDPQHWCYGAAHIFGSLSLIISSVPEPEPVGAGTF